MIKLTSILKEIEHEQNFQKVYSKLTPKEKEQYKQALSILQDKTLDESIKDSLKKLSLSSAVIAALMLSPQLSSAQKASIDDVSKTTAITTKDSVRTSTPIDGILGSVTSRFKFPDMVLKETSYLNNALVKSSETPIKDITNVKPIQIINKFQLTNQQMLDWNDFINWMVEKGYQGSTTLDFKDKKTGQYPYVKLLSQYKAEKNPDFWVNGEDEIKKVQETIKAYRTLMINCWLLGIEECRRLKLPLVMFPNKDRNNPEDVRWMKNEWMKWAR